MPLDPEPVENGNVVVTGTVEFGRDAGTPLVLVLRKRELEEASQQERYSAHQATCPNYRRPHG